MTPEDVRFRLSVIRDHVNDPEWAHGDEDDLRREVLMSIADGSCEDPATVARLALTSSDIEFPRWYA